MKVKCISCEWECDFEGYDWEECPNCDFPYKFQDWIIHLQTRISELERENDSLARKLTGAFGK